MVFVNSSYDDDDDGVVDSINIILLVDVLMVVLVMFIFIVIVQVVGIQINLLKVSVIVVLLQFKIKVILVNDVGQVFFDVYLVILFELEDCLCMEKVFNFDFLVVVCGDVMVQYQKVIEVFDLLCCLELFQVGLVIGKLI